MDTLSLFADSNTAPAEYALRVVANNAFRGSIGCRELLVAGETVCTHFEDIGNCVQFAGVGSKARETVVGMIGQEKFYSSFSRPDDPRARCSDFHARHRLLHTGSDERFGSLNFYDADTA
jgi:hypothetical protein